VNDVDERLEAIARDVFANDELVLSDSMVAADVPGWDSLGHVNFLYSIEQAFGIRFSDEEFAGFSDIGALKTSVRAKVTEP
jgi:acyl carrier protein